MLPQLYSIISPYHADGLPLPLATMGMVFKSMNGREDFGYGSSMCAREVFTGWEHERCGKRGNMKGKGEALHALCGCSGAAQVQLLGELLADTINRSLTCSLGKDIGLADRLVCRAQNATTLEEVVLGNGLERGRLVNDGGLVQDVVSRNDRLNSVVLVSVVADEGNNDVVDVVVNTLVDNFTLVNDLVLIETRPDLILVAVTSSNRIQQLSILVGRRVLLVDSSDWMRLLVNLLSRVLLVLDGLVVDLNVVRVSLQFSLSLDFFNGVRVVRLGRHFSEMLNSLCDLALGQIRVAKVLAVRVSHGAVGSCYLFRSSSAETMAGCSSTGGGSRGSIVAAGSTRTCCTRPRARGGSCGRSVTANFARSMGSQTSTRAVTSSSSGDSWTFVGQTWLTVIDGGVTGRGEVGAG